MELAGKVAVVTGASSGIGRATAWALAVRGATVVPAARRLDRLERLAEAIRAHGGDATPVACDVADFSSVEGMRDAVLDAYGRCDVLVNNAGIPGGGRFARLPMPELERVVRVNFLGVLYCTKAFLEGMLERGQGHVVNVASLAGRFAVPGSAVYSGTKHAVVAFSESLHYETSPQGVRVTTINPGVVPTEGFPHEDAKRARGLRALAVLRARDVAEVVVRVVEQEIAPELSVPRWLAAMQAFRLLTPPFYRFAMRRATGGMLRSTRIGETGRPATSPDHDGEDET